MLPRWRWYEFDDLPNALLYEILQLRTEIFVVEQNCVFQDMDGLDLRCEHLCDRAPSGALAAYLRLVPPGLKFDGPSLGRVVVRPNLRKAGLGRELMAEGLRRCAERHPDAPVFLSGQRYLQAFYESLGFAAIGAEYLEDGIPHIDMRRPAG